MNHIRITLCAHNRLTWTRFTSHRLSSNSTGGPLQLSHEHPDGSGRAHMVDVGQKPRAPCREAVASGRVCMAPHTLQLVRENCMKKGDVLGVARIAGIQAAKQCALLIPLCHQVQLSQVEVDLQLRDTFVHIEASVRASMERTGVEMEALTAVSVAALTVYDMCKAVDKEMVIHQVRLESKSGGTKGDYQRRSHLDTEKSR